MREGDRGPAVEDIQRRLLALGHELGPTGVDGVFMTCTTDAVKAFQEAAGLPDDGVVDRETWVALVDAGFTLGDRMLYLRHPRFHGNDVQVLQAALNALGFACGSPDGIFGAYGERAVREFQLNSGQSADGIAGPETVRTLLGLRHVWEGKDPTVPVPMTLAPARRAEVLLGSDVLIDPTGERAADVAGRLVNLAQAAEPSSRLRIVCPGESDEGAGLVLRLVPEHDERAAEGVPSVAMAGLDGGALTARFVTAMASSTCVPSTVEVVLGGKDLDDERAAQRTAVMLLDAVCAALA